MGKWVIAADVLINLNNVKTVSIQDNILEISYPDGTITEVAATEGTTVLDMYKKVIALTGVDADIGGELVG